MKSWKNNASGAPEESRAGPSGIRRSTSQAASGSRAGRYGRKSPTIQRAAAPQAGSSTSVGSNDFQNEERPRRAPYVHRVQRAGAHQAGSSTSLGPYSAKYISMDHTYSRRKPLYDPIAVEMNSKPTGITFDLSASSESDEEEDMTYLAAIEAAARLFGPVFHDSVDVEMNSTGIRVDATAPHAEMVQKKENAEENGTEDHGCVAPITTPKLGEVEMNRTAVPADDAESRVFSREEELEILTPRLLRTIKRYHNSVDIFNLTCRVLESSCPDDESQPPSKSLLEFMESDDCEDFL